MQINTELTKHRTSGNLHHAYLLVGEASLVLSALEDFLRTVFPNLIDPKSSSDVLWFIKERLDKDDARFLRHFQKGKDFAGQGRFIVVSFLAMATEAQEVLLKTLEEPSANTYFFLIAPNIDIFRSTILSRVYLLKTESFDNEKNDADLEKFLNLDSAERSDYLLKTFLLDGQIKDRLVLFNWLNRLEKYIRARIDLAVLSDNLAMVFKEIFFARELLNSPRSSAKMILEHLALIIPMIRKTR